MQEIEERLVGTSGVSILSSRFYLISQRSLVPVSSSQVSIVPSYKSVREGLGGCYSRMLPLAEFWSICVKFMRKS